MKKLLAFLFLIIFVTTCTRYYPFKKPMEIPQDSIQVYKYEGEVYYFRKVK